MTILFLVLPLALAIAAAAVVAFVWAVKTGQFDDLDTPPMRVLYDDEPPPASPVPPGRPAEPDEPPPSGPRAG